MSILRAIDAAITTFVNELFPLPPAVFDAEWLAEREAMEEVSEPHGLYYDEYGWINPLSTPSDVASAGVPAGVSTGVVGTPPPVATPVHPLDAEELESAAHAVRWFADEATDVPSAWEHLAIRLETVRAAMK